MATSSPPSPPQPQKPPPSPPYHDPPLGVPLLLPAPPLSLPPPPQPPSSSRRLPPPCWTPEETSALIDFYREKWYSLRRGNLRAAHWQEVADDIHRSCPEVLPPKTAVQCRHKMEKLRKRYRAELQRAQSIPHHRFSSSWVYFYKMDAMEKGNNNNISNNNRNDVGAAVAPVNFVVNGEVVKDYNGNYYNINDNCVGFDDMNVNYGNLNDNDDGDGDGDGDGDEGYDYGSEFRKDYQSNGLKIRIAGNSRKSYGGFEHVSNSNLNPNPNPRFGRFSEFSTPPPPLARPQFEEGMRFGARDLKNGGGGSGSGGSSGGSFLGSGMEMNAVMKKRRSALGKRGREEEREGEGERERGKGGDGLAAMEMVEAIRVMGEGFMRVEQMKMEMVRQSERERMEYEMKRTQMILESQRRIVEAFAKGCSELGVNNGDNDDNDVRNDDGKSKDES